MEITHYVRPPHSVLRFDDIADAVHQSKDGLSDQTVDIYKKIGAALRAGEWESVRIEPMEAGHLDYYVNRAEAYMASLPRLKPFFDSLGLTPESSPPDYFLNYGEPNMTNFALLKMGRCNEVDTLSPPGSMWRNNTLRALQEAIELLVVREPVLALTLFYFDQKQFREYAFKSHLVAYTKSGLYALPTGDVLTIVTTGNDHMDLFTASGLSQAIHAAVFAPSHRNSIRALYDSFVFRAKSLEKRDTRLIHGNTLSLLSHADNLEIPRDNVMSYFSRVYRVSPEADLPVDESSQHHAEHFHLRSCLRMIRKEARVFGKSFLGALDVLSDVYQLVKGLIRIAFRLPADAIQALKALPTLAFRFVKGLFSVHRHRDLDDDAIIASFQSGGEQKEA